MTVRAERPGARASGPRRRQGHARDPASPAEGMRRLSPGPRGARRWRSVASSRPLQRAAVSRRNRLDLRPAHSPPVRARRPPTTHNRFVTGKLARRSARLVAVPRAGQPGRLAAVAPARSDQHARSVAPSAHPPEALARERRDPRRAAPIRSERGRVRGSCSPRRGASMPGVRASGPAPRGPLEPADLPRVRRRPQAGRALLRGVVGRSSRRSQLTPWRRNHRGRRDGRRTRRPSACRAGGAPQASDGR